MRKIITIAVTLLISNFGFSQNEKQVFSLQQAIEYAMAHNRTAKNAALDIKAAEKQKWETIATGLPQINAEVGYQNWIKQQISLIDINGDGREDELVFGTKQTMTATATLTQKLFDGSYLVGLQSAKVFLEISKNAKEKTDLEVRKAVISAYGNALLANESIAILKRNIAVLEKNCYESQKIYENGLGEQESVEQLKITLSSVKSNLNNAKRLKQLAYKMLNLTIGKDVDAKIELTDTLEALTTQNISLSVLDTQMDIENTIDYKIAANDKQSKALLVKLEKSKALPTLNAFVNGGYAANSNMFTFSKSNQKWFGSSLLGVTLKVPLFSSGMRSAATHRAQINLEKAEANLAEAEQKIKLETDSAKSNYQLAIEEYQNKKENLALAERIEKKNQTKFFEGVGSSFDLRQAQTQLYTSQNELLQAMINVINTKTTLETVLNKL